MKIDGTYEFGAPLDTVWPMLLDPEVLTHIMPGAEKLDEIGENQYEGILRVKVGPVNGKFNGKITIENIKDHESYDMKVDGRGPAGFVNGTGGLRLEENDPDSCTLHYEGDVQVGGRIASVGQRLLETSAKAIIRQSLDGLDQQVARKMAGDEPGAGEEEATFEPIAAPSQSEFALGVARNFAEELTTTDEGRDMMRQALMVLGGILLFFLLSNWQASRVANKVTRNMRDQGGE